MKLNLDHVVVTSEKYRPITGNAPAPDFIPSSLPSDSKVAPTSKREPPGQRSVISTIMSGDDHASFASIQSLHASPDSITSKSPEFLDQPKVNELAFDE